MAERTRAKKKHRKTAIVPRVVFQTVVALAVVPSAAALATGCGGMGPAAGDAGFSVAMPHDSGFGVADVGTPRDTGMFSVAMPVDSGFGVADVGPPPTDSGMFSVAMPLDSGAFGVAAEPPDGAVFGVAAMADEDAG